MFINITKQTKQNNKKKKRISPSVVACIGTIIIIIGGFFLSYNYIMTKKVMVYEYMNNVFYAKGNENDVSVEEENINNSDQGIDESEMDPNQYIGYLEIPKLNFKKEFYPKNSELNDVDKNLLLVKESSYPNVSKGNLIIAGHSGTAWNSFFNDLYKLSVGDETKVIFNNKTYTYKIVNIYKAPKVGQIAVYRNKNRTTLTLVTCTNNDSTTQTIYISELEKVE